MNAIKNLLYDIRIGRKWEKLNKELYLQDIRDFESAVNMSIKAMKQDVKACKAYDKAIARASRKLSSVRY